MEKQKQVQEVLEYLEAGTYYWDDTQRVLFKQDQRQQTLVKNLAVNKPLSLEIEPVQDQKFAGNRLWFCSNGDLKIFSDTQVLSVCSSRENYGQKIAAYDYFSQFFRLPKLLARDDAQQQLLEERITFADQTVVDACGLLATIYTDYINYFRQAEVKWYTLAGLLATSANRVYRAEFEQLIAEIPAELLAAEWPYLKLHGDLWTENLLLEKDSQQLYYIDWDESGEYLFFYDFFKLMWNELDVHQNYSYYENYLAGRFDAQLAAVFDLFQLEFQPAAKKAYFYLFFLNFLLDETGSMSYEVRRFEWKDFREKVLCNVFEEVDHDC